MVKKNCKDEYVTESNLLCQRWKPSCKNFNDKARSGWPKNMNSEAVLQAKVANPASSTWKVSGKLSNLVKCGSSPSQPWQKHPEVLNYQNITESKCVPYRERVKLAILVEGELKSPFSIATTPRCRRGLHFTLDPYLIMLSTKQGGIKYHFWVFGMTQPRIEPRSPRPLANTLLIRPRERLCSL